MRGTDLLTAAITTREAAGKAAIRPVIARKEAVKAKVVSLFLVSRVKTANSIRTAPMATG